MKRSRMVKKTFHLLLSLRKTLVITLMMKKYWKLFSSTESLGKLDLLSVIRFVL